jgi:hypothetical protein
MGGLYPVRLVRGRDETCPVSTRKGTRLVRLVRERGGGAIPGRLETMGGLYPSDSRRPSRRWAWGVHGRVAARVDMSGRRLIVCAM